MAQSDNDSSKAFERRCEERKFLNAEVSFGAEGKSLLYRVIDISSRGMRLVGPKAFDEGHQLALTFWIEGKEVHARGTVNWSWGPGDEGAYQMGLRLEVPDLVERDLFDVYVDSLWPHR